MTLGVADLRFDERGLIPAVVQQHDSGDVLMLAWMTADTLAETLQRGETVFWSRSRGERWRKGAASGNVQRVVEVVADCDGDVVLVRVDQGGTGVACHTGARSCFHRPLGEGGGAAAAGGWGPGMGEGGRARAAAQPPAAGGDLSEAAAGGWGPGTGEGGLGSSGEAP